MIKTKKCYFLLVIGAISIVVGLVLLPPRWFYVIFGTFAFIAGSVVQYEEWKTEKKLRAIIFVITLTVGGLLTTLGWDKWGDYSQQKALIRALASEWLVNELYQHIEPLSFDPNDPNLGEKRIIYLPFKTFASNSVLTSHLFDLQDKDERELCRTACLYETNATTCNIMFTLLDWDLTREGTAKERRKEVYQQVVRYNRPYREFKESHEKLRKILKEKYKWALEEAKPLVEAAKIWIPSE